MAISVHIIGPGYGESIVLELPDGTLGVVDSFVVGPGDSRRCPPYDLLQELYPGRRVSFLAVTHPHADHCRGASHLIQSARPGQLWLFETYEFTGLQGFFRRLFETGRRDASEEWVDAESGAVGYELMKLCSQADRHPDVRRLRPDHRFFICDKTVAITFLTPEDSVAQYYRRSLRRNLESLATDGPTLNPDWQPKELDHNLVSGALLVEHGATRLLFLADVVEPSWTGWQRRAASLGNPDFAPVHLLKAGHHGSVNGFFPPLYDAACAGGKTIAVVTPFDRQRSPLPSRDGTALLTSRAAEILCTNWPKACLSTEAIWYPSAPGDEAVPAELVRDLTRLWKLRERLNALRTGADDDDARQMLLQALKRDSQFQLRRRESEERDRVHHDFCASFYFDDQGREDRDRRKLGRWIGQLRISPRNRNVH